MAPCVLLQRLFKPKGNKMYTDIEKQLDDIETKMYAKLKATNSIDADKNVINIELFKIIVQESINSMKKLNSQVEQDGFVHDRYGFNILQARIDFWTEKYMTGTLPFIQPMINHEEEIFKKGRRQPSPIASKIKRGVTKLFKRSKPTPPICMESDRQR